MKFILLKNNKIKNVYFIFFFLFLGFLAIQKLFLIFR